MRILFTTLQQVESDFYGRVGDELRNHGHEPVHLTYSRRAASVLARRGNEAICLPELMSSLEVSDVEREAARIRERYEIASLRGVYGIDSACERRPEHRCVERTVRHFLAIERIFDEYSPQAVVPEVGTETMRTAAHLIGLQREVPVLFLFYTLFPSPLRLYVDTMHAPIVAPGDLRELSRAERGELEAFVDGYKRDDAPIRSYRAAISAGAARSIARHLVVKAAWDRDNEYLRPLRWIGWRLGEVFRRVLVRAFYEPFEPGRPYVYFPLHVSDDYKIRRLVPDCEDQVPLIELVAASLPDGVELVTKEHPMSIGRTPLGLLRRLGRAANVRVVPPRTSSHALIRDARAVVVIGSTVGLEALLYGKPVLTLGQPFYSGLGVTQDVDSFRELPRAVPALLRFRPSEERIARFLHAAWRRCLPGAPALVDRSDANARTLAGSLHGALEETPAAVRDGEAGLAPLGPAGRAGLG